MKIICIPHEWDYITDLKKQQVEFMNQLEKDYSENSEKPLLIPQNNREYWLFTEIWLRCAEFFGIQNKDIRKLINCESCKTVFGFNVYDFRHVLTIRCPKCGRKIKIKGGKHEKVQYDKRQ